MQISSSETWKTDAARSVVEQPPTCICAIGYFRIELSSPALQIYSKYHTSLFTSTVSYDAQLNLRAPPRELIAYALEP